MHPVPFAKPEDFVRLGQLCERLGYCAVWGNDHITTQRYVRELHPQAPPNFYEVMMVLAFVAASTTTLQVGTAVSVVPMRDPVWLAKQFSTLDQLSGGRALMGVGVGAYREEFESVLPRLAPQANRGAMLEEGVQLMRRLFMEPRVDHAGHYYACKGIEMYPKPVQSPLPIYFGGHNLAAIERAAKWGQGWMPAWRPWPELEERIGLLRGRCEEAGRSPDDVEVAIEFSVTVDDSDAKAEARYLATRLVAHRKSLAYTGRDLSQQVVCNLIGSPETIAAKLQELASIGVDHCCALMFPTETVSEFEEQVAWFAAIAHPAANRVSHPDARPPAQCR
jgi:probable F420-dependent oxidoreductase